MAGPRFRSVKSLDRTRADLILSDEGKPNFVMPVDAAGLENLIRQLAMLRSQMLPETEMAPPTSAGAEIEHIRWRSGLEAVSGRPVLQLRHPGIGWITLILDHTECEELGSALLRSAEMSRQAPTAKPN